MEQGLVKQSTTSLAFVENAKQSIENMMSYAEILLKSGLCPAHFYEKDDKGKPILSKGKPAAVVMVLQHGFEVGLSAMQALQQVVPVNGLISIKGDGAKSLIFQSGVLKHGSWKEEESGSIEKEDYRFSITATRIDNGLTMTRSFSVNDAKRAGLWIEKKKIEGQDGWKYKLSAWYKFPERMVRYRALGFISRDLFSDVLAGMYTSEEAMDLPQDTTTTIETPSGASIIIPDKDFNQERSQSLTNKASEKIDKIMQQNSTAIPGFNLKKLDERIDEIKENKETETIEEKAVEKVWTKEDLKAIETPELLKIVESNEKTNEAVTIITGKNTAKKLIAIILAHQEGRLDEIVDKYRSEKPEELKEEDDDNKISDVDIEDIPDADIQPNTSFDSYAGGNKFNIVVPGFPEGKTEREFDAAKPLYKDMKDIAGIDNVSFDALLKNRFPEFQKYISRDKFCTMASVEEINTLLNSVD